MSLTSLSIPEFIAEHYEEIDDDPRILTTLLAHQSWHVRATVDKFDQAEELDRLGLSYCAGDELLSEGIQPTDRQVWSEHNVLCNNGINRLINLVIGTGSIVAFTNSVARLGVGNGTSAAANTDTDLSAAAGSSNRWFKASDSTYPSASAQTITEKATFATGDANFAWNEWGIDGGVTADGTTVGTNDATHCALLNHVKPGSSLGTKASGSSWAFTVTIVIS